MPFAELVEVQIKSGSVPAAIGHEEEFIKERIALHETPQGEMLREYADGTWFIVKESRTDDGGYVATNTDITELKRTEGRLVESERRMRQLVEALQDGFALFDPDDRLIMWNNSWFERHLGISNAVKVGATFEELSRAMMVSQQIPEVIGREDAYVAERVHAHKNPGPPMQRKMNDGRWYIITEIHTEDGGILSLQSDITDIKSAEENAERLRLEAELANQAKSSLLVNMSHELRTPLNAIIGFSQILEQELFGPLGNDRYRDYASDVNNAGQHLLSLINDLLDISKIELGEAELAEAEINLQECLGSCARMIEQRAVKTGVSVTLDIAPRPLVLRVDERRLKQIVLNIAGNAVKFSQENGLVSIRAILLESGACQFSVEDHGAGISEDDLLRVTEPFYQTNGTYARQTDGIGLGLYIAKSLCGLHDAELTFESKLGKGTTVAVTFPPERTIRTESDQHVAE
jgi:signal transduction histidine kinase